MDTLTLRVSPWRLAFQPIFKALLIAILLSLALVPAGIAMVGGVALVWLYGARAEVPVGRTVSVIGRGVVYLLAISFLIDVVLWCGFYVARLVCLQYTDITVTYPRLERAGSLMTTGLFSICMYLFVRHALATHRLRAAGLVLVYAILALWCLEGVDVVEQPLRLLAWRLRWLTHLF